MSISTSIIFSASQYSHLLIWSVRSLHCTFSLSGVSRLADRFAGIHEEEEKKNYIPSDEKKHNPKQGKISFSFCHFIILFQNLPLPSKVFFLNMDFSFQNLFIQFSLINLRLPLLCEDFFCSNALISCCISGVTFPTTYAISARFTSSTTATEWPNCCFCSLYHSFSCLSITTYK